MKTDEAKKKIRHVSEIDYPILCDKFGEEKAIQIMLLSRAINEEAMIKIGAAKAPPDKPDC